MSAGGICGPEQGRTCSDSIGRALASLPMTEPAGVKGEKCAATQKRGSTRLQSTPTGLPAWGSGQPGQAGNRAALTAEPVPGSRLVTLLIFIFPPQTTTPYKSRALDGSHRLQAARRRSTGNGMVLTLACAALRGTD